ncbi:MAG TPA: hypothetical protein PL056_11100 [bacterium]|nr:hypothetical protein [bacterium]
MKNVRFLRLLLVVSLFFSFLLFTGCDGGTTDKKTKKYGSEGGYCYPDGTCDEGYECNETMNMCFEAEINDTGDTDDTGNTGDTGNSGDSGDTGNSGNTGNSGDTGNTGNDVCEEWNNGEIRNCKDFDSFERCTDGSWVTVLLAHKGLEWSCVAPEDLSLADAISYCKDIGGHLPNISELRTLIKGCSATITGGSCGVTDECRDINSCWSVACDGCSHDDDSGKYSIFGDTSWFGSGYFWSSSVLSIQGSDSNNAWYVFFDFASLGYNPVSYESPVRCVR